MAKPKKAGAPAAKSQLCASLLEGMTDVAISAEVWATARNGLAAELDKPGTMARAALRRQVGETLASAHNRWTKTSKTFMQGDDATIAQHAMAAACHLRAILLETDPCIPTVGEVYQRDLDPGFHGTPTPFFPRDCVPRALQTRFFEVIELLRKDRKRWANAGPEGRRDSAATKAPARRKSSRDPISKDAMLLKKDAMCDVAVVLAKKLLDSGVYPTLRVLEDRMQTPRSTLSDMGVGKAIKALKARVKWTRDRPHGSAITDKRSGRRDFTRED